MPSQLTFHASIIMERVAINNRWQPHKWQPAGVLPDDGTRGAAGSVVTLNESDALLQRLWPGFALEVFSDEAEGYFLNVTSPTPCVFVMWRLDENNADGDAFPHSVTLSYNEAARWMDAQEKVDHVAMPAEIFAALSAWVEENYKPPEKKRRIRPKSFESKEGRYDASMNAAADAPPRGEQ
jgi:hypothetical protein